VKLPRRTFLRLAAGAAALPAVSRIARAQSYPSRTVRIVVGFPAGQAIDISARLMAEWLQQRLGQSFIVENRPGAAANVATEMVARSPADGYTLLIISSNNVINTTLYGTVDFAREIAPIATFGRGYQVLNVKAPGGTGGFEPWTDEQVDLAELCCRPHLSRVITLASNTGQ